MRAASSSSMTRGATGVVRPLDYTAMRLLRFRAALIDFLRRWGIYFGIVVVLFGAGTNAPVAIAASLAALFVWPLRHAAAHGAMLVPMTIGYAVVGALPVMATRTLWWPRRWAAAERALPLPAAVVERSDRLFAGLLMTPWQAVLVVGIAGTWRGGDTGERWSVLVAWLVSTAASLRMSTLWMRAVRGGDTGERWSVLAARLVSTAASLRLSTRWMRAVRGGDTGERAEPAAGAGLRSSRTGRTMRRVGVHAALILLPMRRGRARRSAFASIVGPLVTIACAVGPVGAGWSVDWAFAFAACAALCWTSVLRASTIAELRPFWNDSRQLPLDARACERVRVATTLLPLGHCALGCVVAAALTRSPVRPQVCILYGLVVSAGCFIEALTPPKTVPSDHAARWLLTLVAAVAFASEISPS